jgi:Subtilase family/IPT/TIG domain
VNGQGYRKASSAGGIDADFAQTVAGGRGENVRIFDLEYSWNREHEDLSKARATGSDIAKGAAVANGSDDHGTPVLGEIAGDDDGFGVTGLAPKAWSGTVNTLNQAGWNIAQAVMIAARNASAGDVILIEQQVASPGGACDQDQVGCVAVVWDPLIYDAIVSATSRGITVVEVAGNGQQNLDDQARFGTVFPAGRCDSGAMIVGAGAVGGGCTSPARARLSFSNDGKRVDLQGSGECITTTGYGALQNTTEDAYSTNSSSGTSSASPIVASAAAVLSSIAEQRGITSTPKDVRSLLQKTGTAQPIGTGNIGPLPNLSAAIDALPPTVVSFAPASALPGASVTITGTNLTGATAVKLNGVGAVVTGNSATQITATVPLTATTGPISVTTATGTATSVATFAVMRPLLTNGGFESGANAAPWVANSGVVTNSASQPAKSGAWYAWLAGFNNANDTLYEDVAIPAGVTSASLSIWVHIDTRETDEQRQLHLLRRRRRQAVRLMMFRPGAVPDESSRAAPVRVAM